MQESLRYLAPGYCVRASLLIRHFDTILIVVLHNFCVAVRHRINAAETYTSTLLPSPFMKHFSSGPSNLRM